MPESRSGSLSSLPSKLLSALSWTLLVAAASPAVAQLPLVMGQVYDANNVFVGTVIDFDQNQQRARVHGQIQGSIVEFSVFNEAVEEYLDPKTKRVYFANGDCTGQAYVLTASVYPSLGGILAGAGGPVQYYFAPSGTPSSLAALGSSRDFEVATCDPQAANAMSYPVTPISLGYALPYRMTTQQVTSSVLPIPTLQFWGLLGLAVALGFAGLVVLRARHVGPRRRERALPEPRLSLTAQEG